MASQTADYGPTGPPEVDTYKQGYPRNMYGDYAMSGKEILALGNVGAEPSGGIFERYQCERSAPLLSHPTAQGDEVVFADRNATQRFPHLPLDTNTSRSPGLAHSSALPHIRPRQYFCTFCFEEGRICVLQRKADWKRHMENIHKDKTGLQRICKVKGCDKIFECRADCEKHQKREHYGVVRPPNSVKSRQTDRIYACGFDMCFVINDTWNKHCKHVADCMHSRHKSWTHDKIIRNLLRHHTLSASWKQISDDLHHWIGISQDDLQWNFFEAQRKREQLETGDFGGESVENFLVELYQMGIADPIVKGSVLQMVRLSRGPSLSSVPPVPCPNSGIGRSYPSSSWGIYSASPSLTQKFGSVFASEGAYDHNAYITTASSPTRSSHHTMHATTNTELESAITSHRDSCLGDVLCITASMDNQFFGLFGN